jgi:hypothetical protein
LWGLFKALIAGALNETASLLNTKKHDVLDKIEQTIVDFFTQVMQLIIYTAARSVKMSKVHFYGLKVDSEISVILLLEQTHIKTLIINAIFM